MKKLILVFAAIAITASAYAQNDSLNKKMNPWDKNQNQNMQNNPDDKTHPDGVMMLNGQMMKVENGQMTVLDEDMTLSNGTKIMVDGTCIKEDGTKVMLKEGQHMDMSGNIVFIKADKEKNMDLNQNMPNNPDDKSCSSKKTNKDKNMDLNENLQDNPVDKSYPDGVVMHNGQMMKVKNGKMTVLQNDDMTMSDGTKIMSDGTCIKKDGTRIMMKEGQHMDMSGNMNFMKTNKDRTMYLVPDSISKEDF